MTHRGTAIAAMLLVIGLAGCSGSSTPSASAPTTPATTTSTTTTPSPTPTYASEKEVASVIAGGEKTWREAIEKGGECRMALVLKEDGLTASSQRLTCYTNEITAGLQAQIALRDLNTLDIPPSMQSLVDETKQDLQMMVDADLEKVCGPAMTEPKDTDECSSALGTRSMSYTVLSSQLDKWSPYL